MENEKPHAILIAYPLQGHVIPSVHLAMKLASRGFTITFVNTDSIHHQTCKARNLTTRGKSHDDDIFSGARKSGLDIRYMTVADGLPTGFDRSLKHDQFMASLLHVFSAHVEDLVERILRSSENPPVKFLIADTFFVWPATIAKKFGLSYVSFWTEPAVVFTLYYHHHLLRQNRHFDSHGDIREDPIDYVPGVRNIERKDLMSYLQETTTTTVCHQIIFKAFEEAKEADFVICNTVEELEPETVSALRSIKPFYAVGPVFPLGSSSVATSLWCESDCNDWLDSQESGRVLYVSFGSYAHVSKEDLVEIAHGLLLSGITFLWVLRPDIVSSEEADPLPAGFEGEAGARGIVVPWCCQAVVLAHPSVGGFLTHCGWNSILESIWWRVPLLCFPLLTDQFTNRKLVVDDWRIGINLVDTRPVTRDEVSKNIRRLMSEKSGDGLREKVEDIRSTVERALSPGGSSEKNIHRLVHDLTTAMREAQLPSSFSK